MKSERFDIHQHITDQIIAAIERGAGEFRLPWHRSAGNIMRPANIASKKAYRGVNVLTLWATADAQGYSSGTWGTYRQWAEAGAQVRKGEKAAYIVFYKEFTVAADDATATRPKPASSPAPRRSSPPSRSTASRLPSSRRPRRSITPIEQAEAFVAATGAAIQHGGSRAFYRPSTDSIQLAPARGLHRHRDEHAGRGLLFHPASRADPLDEP